ncbi:MAG: dipeptidase [Gammaproteobacteria bacterium]|nr:dipeptidase [Gammaproteobacteria bacterium]
MSSETKDFRPNRRLNVCLLCLFLIGVGCSKQTEQPPDFSAERFARETLLLDSHIDTPFAISRGFADVISGDSTLEFDYPRAVEGGLDVAFMSIYVPAAKEEDGTATDFADELIDYVESLAKDAPSKFALATCTQDIEAIKKQGKIALPMGMENGAPIAGELEKLDYFYKRGIRYLTLVHSKHNHLADSSYDEGGKWDGLSPFGRDIVKAMNDIGMVIDISHLTDDAAWDVLEMSQVSVAATHSSLRHFVPGFHRNIPDELVIAVGEAGGVVMINFGSGFVSAPARSWSDKRKAGIAALRLEYPNDDSKVSDFIRTYEEQNQYPFASVSTVVDHIDRVVQLTSIDNVGFGSDYEGVGPTMPRDLKDVSKFPLIVQELWDRGYTREDMKKILGENYMRVWAENEQYARAMGNPIECTHE